MEQTAGSDVYKIFFIATIEAYEDILNLDMTQFRKQIRDLFKIKSHKNLKQAKVEKYESREYQYKITCSYCKKIKNDPNNYVNQMYAEIVETKYLRAIQRGFDLALRPDLLLLESKFKLIQKRQSSQIKPKSRSRHNSHNMHSNGKAIKTIKPTKQNIEKQRRNTYDPYDSHRKYKPAKKKRKINPNNNNNNNNERNPVPSNKNDRKKPRPRRRKKRHSDGLNKVNREHVHKKQRRHTHAHRDAVPAQNHLKSDIQKKDDFNKNDIYSNKSRHKHHKNTFSEGNDKSNRRPPAPANRGNEYDDPAWSPPQPYGPPPTVTVHGTVTYYDDIKPDAAKPSNNTHSKPAELEIQDLKAPNISHLKPPNNAILSHVHQKSASFVVIDSIRTKVTALHPSKNPAQGLLGLWIIVVVVIVCCLALLSTVDGFMADIYIDLDTEGTFIWSLGWMNNMFFYLNGATCTACLYDSFDRIEAAFPIPNTLQYMKNAGYLLTSSVGLILLCIVCILRILCERRNSHEPLYIKVNCLNIRIPQRPTVYFAWNIIALLTWACIAYYIMLSLYAFFETSFYLGDACPSGLMCHIYVAPHYGLVALFCIVAPISCCALCCTRRLDPKFDDKTLSLYFPDHAEKVFEESQINLKQLFSCINVVKNIIVLAFIMTKFKDVGMINIVFYNETDAAQSTKAIGQTNMFYLQFQGLTNTDGVAENSYLSVLNSEMYTYNDIGGAFTNVSNVSNTSTHPIKLQDEASTMSTIASVWDWLIWIIMIINVLMVAPYILYVILEYSSTKWIKFAIIGITFIQWLGHLILIVMYYYEYSVWFSNYAKSVLESELYDATDSIFDVYWFPDWGILIAILLSFYLLKMMYAISKAI